MDSALRELIRVILSISIAALLVSACSGSEDPIIQATPVVRYSPTRPTTPTFEWSPIAEDHESVARGEAIYAASCAACHGEEGQGAGLDIFHPPPPNFGVFNRPELTDQAVRRLLVSASSDHPRPSIEGRPLTDEEIVDVISFSRSISLSLDDGKNFKCEDCHGVDMSGG